jgi:hypothetical protein
MSTGKNHFHSRYVPQDENNLYERMRHGSRREKTSERETNGAKSGREKQHVESKERKKERKRDGKAERREVFG